MPCDAAPAPWPEGLIRHGFGTGCERELLFDACAMHRRGGLTVPRPLTVTGRAHRELDRRATTCDNKPPSGVHRPLQ
jgi:hypothetical protein